MSNKFITAKFFDATEGDDGEWKEITPDEFVHDMHEGLIQCPDDECNGSLILIDDYLKNGSNTTTNKHFKVDVTGEPHETNCPYEAGIDHGRVLRMEDVLAAGKKILINVNFVTSFNKDVSRLSPYIARKAMPKINGEYRPDWIKEHTHGRERQYSTFSVSDIEKVSARLREFKQASERALGTEDRSKIVVSYLHGALPWASFYTKDAKGSITVDKSETTPQSIFEDLYEEMNAGTKATTLWRPAPASRMKLEPLPNAWGNKILTKTFGLGNSVTIDDQDFQVQDTLIIPNPELREKIKNANAVSFVATPFISTKDVESQIEKGTGFVHLNWAIGNDKQVILHND